MGELRSSLWTPAHQKKGMIELIFFHESIGKKDNNGHIVDRDGGKNKIDVGETSNMVKLVGLHCGEFGSKFVDNELMHPGLFM